MLLCTVSACGDRKFTSHASLSAEKQEMQKWGQNWLLKKLITIAALCSWGKQDGFLRQSSPQKWGVSKNPSEPKRNTTLRLGGTKLVDMRLTGRQIQNEDRSLIVDKQLNFPITYMTQQKFLLCPLLSVERPWMIREWNIHFPSPAENWAIIFLPSDACKFAPWLFLKACLVLSMLLANSWVLHTLKFKCFMGIPLFDASVSDSESGELAGVYCSNPRLYGCRLLHDVNSDGLCAWC